MADIASFTDPLVAAIYAEYERRNEAEKARTYLGASIIGKECERALWYSFRWAAREKFDGRMLRLFQTGHLSEPRFVSDLRSVGVEIYDVDPASGKQFGFHDLGGHMRGHMDGAATAVPRGGRKWHVVEFKTHSSKSFDKLKKDGVKKAKPEHHAQMTWYMGKSGMDRALYLAVNKDTDELYSERIEFDPTEFAKIMAKAERIIFAQQPPSKISDDPKFYLCGWCPHNDVCHGHRVPAPSCRTCVHSTPEHHGDARWSCAKDTDPNISSIPVEVQRTGCGEHLPLPFLLTYAAPIDAGDGWIMFQRQDNAKQFVVTTPAMAATSICSVCGQAQIQSPSGVTCPNGHGGADSLTDHFHRYTSHEISAAADHRAIGDDAIAALRAQHPGASLVG